MKRILFTGAIAGLYSIFWQWYTGNHKPLTSAEIEQYMQKLVDMKADPDQVERMRKFLLSDTGRGFVMVNLIKLNAQPKLLENGEKPLAATSEAILNRYTSKFLPALFKRAGHIILAGRAAGPALDIWGIPGGDDWSTAGIVRYRNRRDLIETSTNPNFPDIYSFKQAAIEKTIAIPVEPIIQIGEPRLIVGLLAIITAIIGSIRIGCKTKN